MTDVIQLLPRKCSVKKSNVQKMRTLIVVTVFLFVSFTFSYPLKPLDERSTELTWQAWLLVDDQNQTKQTDEGGNMKKKVIAKSVFIVPTFSPERCAEGTVPSKSSGRCVQVIQVDPDMQLQFLFNKLQSHLESSHKTSSGPEKFTIEIPQNDGSNDDASAAFVLSPNSKSKDEKDPNNNMVVSFQWKPRYA